MTTLMEEEPYVAVVDDESLSNTCSNCFARNTPGMSEMVKLSRCAGCKVLYYCNAKCQKKDWKDHKTECKFLRASSSVPSETARLVMRMIEKSKTQPEWKSFNGRSYDSLAHHAEIHRGKCMEIVKKLHAEIYSFMGSKAPDVETVLLALSKKVTNCFGISTGNLVSSRCASGIYLGLSVLDHSCRPDAFVVNDGSKLVLRTSKKDCVYSDKLTIDYAAGTVFRATKLRRIRLLTSYNFSCNCEECQDVESNKKRTSGRPSCCPMGWFSGDGKCNICKKDVSADHIRKAKEGNARILNEIVGEMARKRDGRPPLPLHSEWIKLFETYKEVLSDENTYLISIADMIWSAPFLRDIKLTAKYLDLCVPQAKKRSYDQYRANLFCMRFLVYERTGNSLRDIKMVLNEAIETVEIVYGENHEITKNLKQKKFELNFAQLRI